MCSGCTTANPLFYRVDWLQSTGSRRSRRWHLPENDFGEPGWREGPARESATHRYEEALDLRQNTFLRCTYSETSAAF